MTPIMWKHAPEDAGHDFEGILRNAQTVDVPQGGAVLAKCDAGAGPYFVLSCDEMCFDDLAAFDAWAAMVRGVIAAAGGGA